MAARMAIIAPDASMATVSADEEGLGPRSSRVAARTGLVPAQPFSKRI